MWTAASDTIEIAAYAAFQPATRLGSVTVREKHKNLITYSQQRLVPGISVGTAIDVPKPGTPGQRNASGIATTVDATLNPTVRGLLSRAEAKLS